MKRVMLLLSTALLFGTCVIAGPSAAVRGGKVVDGKKLKAQSAMPTRSINSEDLDGATKPKEDISYGSDVFVNDQNFFLGAADGVAGNEEYALSRASIVGNRVHINPMAPAQSNANGAGDAANPLHGKKVVAMTADSLGRPVVAAEGDTTHVHLVSNATGSKQLTNTDKLQDKDGNALDAVSLGAIHALAATQAPAQYRGAGDKGNFIFAATSDKASWKGSTPDTRGISVLRVHDNRLNPLKVADTTHAGAGDNRSLHLDFGKAAQFFSHNADATLGADATVDLYWDDYLQSLYGTVSDIRSGAGANEAASALFRAQFDLRDAAAKEFMVSHINNPLKLNEGNIPAHNSIWAGKQGSQIKLSRPRVMHSSTSKDYLLVTGAAGKAGDLQDFTPWVNALPLTFHEDGTGGLFLGALAEVNDLAKPITDKANVPTLDRSKGVGEFTDADGLRVAVGAHPRYFAQTGSDKLAGGSVAVSRTKGDPGFKSYYTNPNAGTKLAEGSVVKFEGAVHAVKSPQSVLGAGSVIVATGGADEKLLKGTVIPGGTVLGDGSKFNAEAVAASFLTIPGDTRFGEDSEMKIERTNFKKDVEFAGADFDKDHFGENAIFKTASKIKVNTVAKSNGGGGDVVWEQAFNLGEGAVIPVGTHLPIDSAVYNRSAANIQYKVTHGGGAEVDFDINAGERKLFSLRSQNSDKTIEVTTNKIEVRPGHYVGIVGDATFEAGARFPKGTVLPQGTKLMASGNVAAADAGKFNHAVDMNPGDEKTLAGPFTVVAGGAQVPVNLSVFVPAVSQKIDAGILENDEIPAGTKLGASTELDDVKFVAAGSKLSAGSVVGSVSTLTADTELEKVSFTAPLESPALQLKTNVTLKDTAHFTGVIDVKGAEALDFDDSAANNFQDPADGDLRSYVNVKAHGDQTKNAEINLYPAVVFGEHSFFPAGTFFYKDTVIANYNALDLNVKFQKPASGGADSNDDIAQDEAIKLYIDGGAGGRGDGKEYAVANADVAALKAAVGNDNVQENYARSIKDLALGADQYVAILGPTKLPENTKIAKNTVLPKGTKIYGNAANDTAEFAGEKVNKGATFVFPEDTRIKGDNGNTDNYAEVKNGASLEFPAGLLAGGSVRDAAVSSNADAGVPANMTLTVEEGGSVRLKTNSVLKKSKLGPRIKGVDRMQVGAKPAVIQAGGSVTLRGITELEDGESFKLAADLDDISGNLHMGSHADRVIGAGSSAGPHSEFKDTFKVPAGAKLTVKDEFTTKPQANVVFSHMGPLPGDVTLPAADNNVQLKGETTLGGDITLVEGDYTVDAGGSITVDGPSVLANASEIADNSIVRFGSANVKICDMEVVGDKVYIAVAGKRSNENGDEAGIFVSQPIYAGSSGITGAPAATTTGLVRAWTPWRRVAGTNDVACRFGVDERTGNIGYLTTQDGKIIGSNPEDNENRVKFTQWGEGDFDKHKRRLPATEGRLSSAISAALADDGKMYSINVFDEATPGFKAFEQGKQPPVFSMAVATGADKDGNGLVIMIQTGAEGGSPKEFDATKIFEKDVNVFVRNDDALKDLGNIYCSEWSRVVSAEGGYLYVGGDNGVAVLRDKANGGKGFDTATGLSKLDAAGYPGDADWEFVQFVINGGARDGESPFKDVRKLIADPNGEFLYVLTATAVHRVKIARSPNGKLSEEDANDYTTIAKIGKTSLDGTITVGGDEFIEMMVVKSDKTAADTNTILLGTSKGVFINNTADAASKLPQAFENVDAAALAETTAIQWKKVYDKTGTDDTFATIKNTAKFTFRAPYTGGALKKAAADVYEADGNLEVLGVMEDGGKGYLALFRFDVQGGMVKAFKEEFTESRHTKDATGVAAANDVKPILDAQRTDYFVKFGEIEDYQETKFEGPRTFAVSLADVPETIGIAPSSEDILNARRAISKLTQHGIPNANREDLDASEAANIDYKAKLPTQMNFVQVVHETTSGMQLIPGEFGVRVNE